MLDEFTAAWERGQAPAVEDYLDRLDPADSQAAVELIYREFCLAEADGCAAGNFAITSTGFHNTRRRSSG